MSEHTKGPWHARHRSAKTMNYGVYADDGTLLAEIKVRSEVEANRRYADARVMAASTEMLAALRGVLAQHAACKRAIENRDWDSVRELQDESASVMRAAISALAKAGVQP